MNQKSAHNIDQYKILKQHLLNSTTKELKNYVFIMTRRETLNYKKQEPNKR